MALRRNKKVGPSPAGPGASDVDQATALAGADDQKDDDVTVAPPVGARRPLDESEAGGDDVLPRLDLGGMRVPVLADTEVRVEMNEAKEPIAATIVHGGSALQILAFAAPRHSGIWDEVRAEIAASVLADGGQVEEVDAGFGPELKARVRTEAPSGQQGKPAQVAEQALRFVGFDGPRWFMRGVFTGPAATNAEQAGVLEAVLTSIVVVRGSEPMAPRDPLPLRLPREAAAAVAEPAEPAGPTYELPVRCPEITETR
jgi:hypothetical protein